MANPLVCAVNESCDLVGDVEWSCMNWWPVTENDWTHNAFLCVKPENGRVPC